MTNNANAQTAADIGGEDLAHNPGHQMLTSELITGRMFDAIGSLALAFTQLEVRNVADNGKAYPVDATLPAGVEHTGAEIDVNIHSFIQRDVLDCLCWKLGSMVEKKDEAIAGFRSRIRGIVQRDPNADSVQIDILERQLERAIEQRAVINCAYQAAREGYVAEVGEQWQSPAERRAASEQLKDKAMSSPRAERLKALGVFN